jgi:PAS domain S-box-containing protein
MTESSDHREPRRLESLAQYRVLDTDPEATFDDLVRLAAQLCQVPMAIISLIDADRQWFKASVGMDVRETPRRIAFCNQVVEKGEAVTVPDTREDERFVDNPLVTGPLGIRFYAGFPLITPDEACIGTVAVLDSEPRALESQQHAALKNLARVAMHALELRRTRLALEDSLVDQERLLEKVRERDQRIERANRRLNVHLENLPLAVVELDHDLRVVRWSAQARAMFGWESEDVLGKPLQSLRLVQPDDRVRVRDAMTELISAGRDGHVTLVNRNLTRSGRELTCEWHNSARFDSNGTLISILAFVADITARMSAERELDQSKALLEIASRVGRLGGWRIDLAEQKVTWSDEVAAIHDLPPGTVVTTEEGINFYAPVYRDRIREVFTACAGEGIPYDEELQIITARGRRVWVRTIARPEFSPDGSIVAVHGAFQDISDRKDAEEALRRSEARFRHAAEASQAALWDFDMQTGQVEFSEAFRDMLGYQNLEDMPDTLDAYMELMHPDDRERVYREAERLVAGKTADRASAEFRLLTRSGEYRWFQSNSKVIRDDQGRAIRRLGSTIDIHERHVAEEQLREQVERMRGVLETAGDAIITIDEGGVIESVNPAAERMFDYRAADMLGQNIKLLMPEDEQARHDNHLHHYLKTGEARIMGKPQRLQARRRDGSVLPIMLNVSEVRLPERRIFTGFIQDITAEQQARLALETSEQRFRAVARVSTDVIWDLVLDTGALWWSDGLEKTFGYALEEAGDHVDWWTDRVHPDDRERVLESLEAAFRSRGEWHEQYRFLHKDGHYAEVVDNAYVIGADSGRPDRMVGGMKDITDELRARRKLAEQARLLNKAHDAILVADLDGVVNYWNQGAERVYGWTAEQMVGTSLVERLYADHRTWGRTVHILLEADVWDGQVRHYRHDGKERRMQSHLTLVRDKAGEPSSILAINTDVTEKLALEEQLRHSQRLESIGQLTGGVAHDFNNLLTVILGNAELLSESLESDQGLKAMAEMTQAAARRGAKLTRQLLAFSQRQTLEPHTVDMADLVQGMQPLLKQSLPEDIEIGVRHEPDLWKARIDPTQLESALLNLVLNARDAMPNGGRLTITTANRVLDVDYARLHADVQPGRYVELTVTDTGHGIGREHLKRLFEPFFTTKEKGKGTGLGMPMVYGFIKQSEGHINVYSEVGMGTTVRMYLPRGNEQGEPLARKNLDEGIPHGTERVLLVEDDPLVLEHVSHLVSQLGYHVTTASSGSEALELAHHQPSFDLLFTDVIMPGQLRGPDLAREFRRIHPEIRVLFTSGYPEDAITPEIESGEAVHLIQKPYRKADLARRLREVLGD